MGGREHARGPGAGGPSDEAPRFEGALHELVAIGLHRPTLEALLASAPGATVVASDSPIDRGYLLRILDEEVGRQFGHPLRPLVELVLNAIDASREPGATIDVRLGDGHVVVEDVGLGMDLHAIVSRRLVPFSTDKRAPADLGRFGVGFFSVLGLGLAEPRSFALGVTTGDGREGFALRVVAEGGSAADLHVRVRRVAPRRGTRISVRSELCAPDAVRAYLVDALHFFPSARALVQVDGVPVNDGRHVEGGRLFEDVASPGPPPTVARFQLGGRPLTAGLAAATYHAGVKIEACLVVPELALLDFPGTVELTEGRDALKPGPAFDAVAETFYRRLVRLADESGADAAERARLAEVAAQVSALLLDGAGWTTCARELGRALLGDDRHLVGPERAEALVGFLGPGVTARLFSPESFWAERQWQGHMPGEAELLARELVIGPIEPLATLAARRPDLPGLALLAARSGSAASTATAIVRSERPPRVGAGAQPCLGTRAAVLVREDAAALREAKTWAHLYALRASFDRALGLREHDVERDLIVNDPARAAT